MPALLDQFGRPMASTKAGAIGELRAEVARLATLRGQYDAAQTTAENRRHWRFADDLSAAAANSLSVRRTLRMRSRYETLQSNAFGRGIVTTIANDFCSTGPRLQVETEDRALAQRIENAWRAWTVRVRLNRKLRTARLSKAVDGEAFLLAITNPRVRGPVKLDVRGIEADQITTPGWVDGVSPDAVDGIEFDQSTGDPITYHLLSEHPGDRGFIPTPKSKRDIPAEQLIHVFNTDRPGQVRGIPELTPSLPLFAILRRITLATCASAETAASFAAVLKTQMNAFENEGATIFAPFEGVEIERGMMAALPYGYELQQLKAEQPTTNYQVFRDALLAEIARPVNMPRNKVLGDSSGYNFSSSRMDHQIYYHAQEIERGDWEIEVLDRIFEWWLSEAMLIPGFLHIGGRIDPYELPHRWTWRPVASVNPMQDAKTSIALIDAGLMLEDDYLHQQQIDPDRFYAARDRQDERNAERIGSEPEPTNTEQTDE